MMRHSSKAFLTIVAVCGWSAGLIAFQQPQPSGPGSTYQVVKVCSLATVAEVKKFAPWPPHMDRFAKAEEEAIGTRGSSCNYPTVHVQVLSFRQQTIDTAHKAGKLEPVSGVGDEAYVHNNKERFAELYTRVGPHLLTVQMDIGTNQKFDTVKPSLIELAKVFAAKLR